MDKYYIEAGVHRAIAARLAGLTEISAKLFIDGRPPQTIMAPLDALYSYRLRVVGCGTRRHDLPNLIRVMEDPEARSKVPEISLQPLGIPGQPKSIPLSEVMIVDSEEEL